jgi:hypothetical protein
VDVSDSFGNPITGGSAINFTVTGAGQVTPSTITIPDTNGCGATSCGNDPSSVSGCGLGTTFSFTLIDPNNETPNDPAESSVVTVEVDSNQSTSAPGGNGDVTATVSGTVD